MGNTENDKVVQAAVQPTPQTNSERFTNKVLKEFGSNVAGAMQVTDYQKTLIQGYFIVIDRTLKSAEEDRLNKNERASDDKYKNDLPYTWDRVNLNDLALDVVHFARMGLDMMQDNHLFPIPYKNKRGWYDITLMPGYNGIRYIASRYAVELPKNVIIEVVYSTDQFKAIKKSANNRVESYEFDITNAFARGEIIGGFAYIEFNDPIKNELVIMSMRDIEKRKPEKASAEFWGGKKKTKEDGKWVEKDIEGWKDEMVRKTLIREAFGTKHIPIDPKKVDDNYQFMKLREARYADLALQAAIDENANTIVLDAPAPEIPAMVDEGTGEVTENTPPVDDLP